ncbi:fimbrial protein [Pararobbsia alpina]|uniref:Major fimbrial subunit SMF-1 n=1 Tax=Pararobbsia alpina TaxID=621374 RepID=A0A6S7B4A1_9BURK|nr:fimbrial protein [Pararobbsia alpina]CAB3785063.1 Major fimbrial subunit SMF-1 [Pararobbsia alpina]
MKKNYYHSISARALGAALVILSGHAVASDGTISFTGSIDASTCTISTGTSGSFSVPLPTVTAQTLSAVGNTAGMTAFEIKLTGCSDTSGNVKTDFQAGSAVDMASGRLKNTKSGGATNVQIELLNASDLSQILVGKPIGSQNSASTALTTSGTTGTATLKYFARYYATGKTTSGDVASQVTYSVILP